MVEQPKESTVTAIGSLSLVRDAKRLQEQRRDLCQLEIPQPNALIIRKGSWYAARLARLVILGEILEYAEITTCTGLIRSQRIRTLSIGSIIFPQALSEHLMHSESLCEYRAGSNTKLLTLNEDFMHLLEFSREALFYLAHAEAQTIQTLIEHMNALEFDLKIASEDRERAVRQAIAMQHELNEAQKNLVHFEGICDRLATRLPDLNVTQADESNQDSPSAAPEITVLDHQIPIPDELVEDTNETSLEDSPSIPDATSSEAATIPNPISIDPDDGLETLPLEDAIQLESDSTTDEDVLCSMPTVKPPPPPPSDESSDGDETEYPQRKTWKEFPAAPHISPAEDPGDTEQRFTMPGVAPPPDNGPPTSLRRRGLVVPSTKRTHKQS